MLRRLALATVLMFLAVSPVSAAPIQCEAGRRLLEVQSWWIEPGMASRAHLHVGTCFPVGQRVSGIVEFDVRVLLHDSPAELSSLSFDLYDRGPNIYRSIKPVITGPNAEAWFHVAMDTRLAKADGWFEVRAKARATFPSGRKQLTSSGWPIYVANGFAVNGSRSSVGAIIGRGWYDGHGYQNPDLRLATDLLGVKSGTWTPRVRLDKGGMGATPTYVMATVDPDIHAGNLGMVVFQRNGPYTGPISIDTTRLSNGTHSLFLEVDDRFTDGQLSGIQVLSFEVSNP